MKKLLILTTALVLVAAACNKQAVVGPTLENQVRVAVEAELNKPETPAGSKLLSIKIEGDKITLDFNREIQANGQGAFEDTMHRITFAVSTVTLEIKEYIILIEGQRLEEYLKTQETANFKTYTNVKYGFEFKYPGNWSEKSADNRFVFADVEGPSKDKLILWNHSYEGLKEYKRITKNFLGQSTEYVLRRYVKNLGSDEIDTNNTTGVILVKLNADQVAKLGKLEKPVEGVYFHYEFDVNQETQAIDQLDQILITFKFTK